MSLYVKNAICNQLDFQKWVAYVIHPLTSLKSERITDKRMSWHLLSHIASQERWRRIYKISCYSIPKHEKFADFNQITWRKTNRQMCWHGKWKKNFKKSVLKYAFNFTIFIEGSVILLLQKVEVFTCFLQTDQDKNYLLFTFRLCVLCFVRQ